MSDDVDFIFLERKVSNSIHLIILKLGSIKKFVSSMAHPYSQ